jgi:hypothetical protein
MADHKICPYTVMADPCQSACNAEYQKVPVAAPLYFTNKGEILYHATVATNEPSNLQYHSFQKSFSKMFIGRH